MPDIKHLAVGEAGVCDGNRYRLSGLRLPLGIAVLDRDVVCALQLFALGGSALHGGCVHRCTCRHFAGDGDGKLPSVRGCDATARGDLSRMILR